jgi:Holliday junction resolvase RusA-like endonuclease
MVTILHNREYRFIVAGKAESFRTAAAPKYKAKVAQAASMVFAEPLANQMVEIRIDYFHLQSRRMDMDNVAKCIMDALTGIAYQDDKQVSSQRSSSHHLRKLFRLNDEPVDIIKPLKDYDEYVVVRVREVNPSPHGHPAAGPPPAGADRPCT